MPVLPQFFQQSIPKASASLKQYWTRTRSSLTATDNSHRSLAPSRIRNSPHPTHNYLELDERSKPFSTNVSSDSPDITWMSNRHSMQGGLKRSGICDIEHGEDNGIRKMVKIEQTEE